MDTYSHEPWMDLPEEPRMDTSNSIEVTYTVPIYVDEYGEADFDESLDESVFQDIYDPEYDILLADGSMLCDEVRDQILSDKMVWDLPAGLHVVTIVAYIYYEIYDVQFGRYEGDINTDSAQVEVEIKYSPVALV